MERLRERLIVASRRLFDARRDHRSTGQRVRDAQRALDALLEELEDGTSTVDAEQPGLLDGEAEHSDDAIV